ncbi:MAG: HlyD family efflux transporter periplasmic adaptor subunit [Candidatus Solibacter usitatus]|nr:HlyD family efflux transporter periplasmic adaptor subunit [Candidatus Solibacter usitatus]
MTRIARFVLVGAPLLAGVAVWTALGDLPVRKPAPPPQSFDLPVTTVKRGEVRFTVSARGELQGSNSEMLVAPMTGARELIITFLRRPGELIEAGDEIVKFDTTDQEFSLAEAEADLAESEQQVLQAEADSSAREEEARASLIQARSDLVLAELEARKNPLLAAIVARQNALAVEAARDRLHQLEQDLSNRKATSQAGILIQQAARNKAKVKAETARKNIDAMTLKAKSRGYVNVQQNTNSNFMFWGMQLPYFKTGDTARAGMAVAQIPDLQSWEIRAQIAELDRGHLAPGQPAELAVIALPGRAFKGKIKNIGGTNGPPWERKFECVFSLDDPITELRPGMSARITVTTQVLKDALWIPSQALYESDGRAFVYLQSGKSFTPADVKLVRRSESQVVVEGLREGQVVAMASPEQSSRKKDTPSSGGGALKALKGS